MGSVGNLCGCDPPLLSLLWDWGGLVWAFSKGERKKPSPESLWQRAWEVTSVQMEKGGPGFLPTRHCFSKFYTQTS